MTTTDLAVPVPRRRTRIAPEIRFAAKTELGSRPVHLPELGPCEIWTASTVDGYGTFRADTSGNARVYAHLWRWEQMYGPVPDGHQLDHLCHAWWVCAGGPTCVHRRCVALDHLEPVLPGTNTLRGAGAGGRNARKLRCDDGHPLVGSNVYRHPKRGTRHCRTCQAAGYARWAAGHQVSADQLAFAL